MLCGRPLASVSVPGLLLVSMLSGCGGGGGGQSSEDARDNSAGDGQTLQQVLAEPLGQEIACPDLTLSRTSGVPGDRVTITGLPPEMETISLRVIADDSSGDTLVDPLFVRIDELTSEVSFSTPIHPTADPEGGEVRLEPGDGDVHCPKQAFTIEPLPPAPADHPVTVANKLEDWVDQVLTSLGYDPQTILNADPDSLPETRINLWLAKQFVSGGGDDALPALSRRARDRDSDLVARFLMAIGLEQELDRALNELTTTTQARLSARPLGGTRTSLVRANDAGIADVLGDASSGVVSASLAANCEAQSIEPDALEVNSTAQLSTFMQEAQDGSLLSGDASTQAGQSLGGASLLLPERAADAAGHLGTVHFVATTVDSARQALKPRQITDFTVERADTEWVEDRPANDPLLWDGAKVRAKGRSINISEITLKSLVAGAGMASGPIGKAATAVNAVAPDAVNNAIAEVTEDSCVRIRAPEYGPFDVDDSRWTEVETGSTIKLVSPPWDQEYRGVDIGPSALTISLKEGPFALDAPLEESFIVDVVQVNTSLIPSSVNLPQPGGEVALTATATNPHKPDNRDNFAATALGGKGTIRSQSGNGSRYEVTYSAPSKREDYPAYVEFKAQHRTLPSGVGRTYEVEIDIGGELVINERNACVAPGESRSFSATVDGFAAGNESVSWSSGSGSIASTGDLTADFQAPATTGSVDITATADADGSVTDTVTVTVSDNCIRKLWVPQASISLDGSGTYPDGTVSDCGSGDHDEVQLERLMAGNPPVSPADLLDFGDYWYSRTEDLSADFAHNSMRYHYDSEKDQCRSVSLQGSNKTTLEYAAKADGTLSASLDSDIQIQCRDYGNGTVECVGAGASVSLGGGGYVIDLTEKTAYTLQGELSCTGLQGNVGVGGNGVGLTADVTRYVDGQPWTPDPQSGSTGVENPDGSLRSSRLFEVTCDQSDETVPIDVDFVLTAPPAGETHEVVVFLSGGLSAQGNVTGADNFGPPSVSIPQLQAGNHGTSATIDFTLKLSPN